MGKQNMQIEIKFVNSINIRKMSTQIASNSRTMLTDSGSFKNKSH